MGQTNLPIDRVNQFLKKHTFTLEKGMFELVDLNVKFKLNGISEYTSVGEKIDYIQYSIYVLPTNEQSDNIFNLIWGSREKNKDNQVEIFTYDEKGFNQLIRKANDTLESFLKYFSIDQPVICIKIINKII
jgi:hypothetical protein